MSKTIAIQGIEASFHEVAAKKYFGNEIETVKCLSFNELCRVLRDEEADFAMMAIENSIAGSLLDNYKLLQEHSFHIIGEVYLRIKMNLLALKGTKLEDIKFVQSHPIAIRQCIDFLNKLPEAHVEEKEDTALCAKNIATENLVNVGALASEACAEEFGLEILASGVETNKKNFTRFLVLSRVPDITNKNNKASISFQLPHDPGALAKILTEFATANINLTKIQSVPIVGKPYEYYFHVDFEWSEYPKYELAMEKVAVLAENLEILGEYQQGVFEIKD